MAEELLITILDGPRKGKKYIINKTKITLGRNDQCDIVFDDKNNQSVSRLHAEIELTPNGWMLTDKSTNGTYYFDDKILKNSSRYLLNEEVLRLSKNGERIKLKIHEGGKKKEREKSIPDSVNAEFNTGNTLGTPSLTKILPISRKGESTKIRSNPFFMPGLATVITGVLLFAFLQAVIETGQQFYIFLYELFLGLYLGFIIIFAIAKLLGSTIMIRFYILPACFTAFTIFISHAILSPFFQFEIVKQLMQSPYIVLAFLGHFIGAGLIEELIKSLPVWIAVFLSKKYSDINYQGFVNGKLHPSLSVIIASSSAVGFIIVETVFLYVPSLQQNSNVSLGMMLLIPRFITGISGHVAWSGLFAYFISLSQNYKQKKVFLVLTGWCFASALHGLWNACAISGHQILGGLVAITSFILFIVYLGNAKEFRRK